MKSHLSVGIFQANFKILLWEEAKYDRILSSDYVCLGHNS